MDPNKTFKGKLIKQALSLPQIYDIAVPAISQVWNEPEVQKTDFAKGVNLARKGANTVGDLLKRFNNPSYNQFSRVQY